MKAFQHTNAKTVKEAVDVLGAGGVKVIAGGTDLLGTLKDDILPVYPTGIVNIKSIPELDYIKEEGGVLKVGATAKLADIAENSVVLEKYTALAQAAKAVSSPNLRRMSTIGGNINQLPRCWYFRKGEGLFYCNRKGADECKAILGDHRYHSAFGGRRCHDSPCTSECPAGTDIPGYMQQIRAGNWDAAAKIIMKVNPIPAITSRVCAHFCTEKCNRCQTDEAVTNFGVERALGDHILENGDKFYVAPKNETGKSVAIVGSGPAGLSAAFYLRKAGNKVTVYDGKEKAGGMLQYAIPRYRLPTAVVDKVVALLQGMGIEFKLGVTLGKDVAPADLEKQYDSVCYATGTWKAPVLGITGEELTVFGLEFLTEAMKWFQENRLAGKDVFVAGGGNVAMDVAMTAKRLGAKSVTLACLEPRDRMPASKEEIERAEEDGVKIMPGWGLSKVVDANGVATGMELKRCVSPWDASGAFNPSYDDNDKMVVNAEALLMAVGQRVDLSYLDEKYQIQLNRRGLIDVAEDTHMTNRAGVFATGDVVTGPGTVIGAIHTGHMAANGINRYLETTVIEETLDYPEFLTNDETGIQIKTPLKLVELDAAQRAIDKEDTQTPSKEVALAEAKRCLNCGCYAVSSSDVGPALVALNAKIVTSKRTLGADEFFACNTLSTTVLDYDEIVTEIQIPALAAGAKSAFKKFAFRKSIDFPVVNVAVVTGDEPRVCLGAVAPVPYRAVKAEQVLKGKAIDEAVAAAAGEAAVADAHPFDSTKYKVQIAKTLVKRTLLSM